jgi:hypothetical protein
MRGASGRVGDRADTAPLCPLGDPPWCLHFLPAGELGLDDPHRELAVEHVEGLVLRM